MVLEDEDEYEHENDSPTSESRFICYWLLAIRAALAVEETLSRRRLPQGVVPIEVRRLPAVEPLGIEYGAVARIVVAHPGQGFGEPLLQ